MLRPTQVRQYVNFMQSRGFAASAVLAGTGIDADRLSDSAYLVELNQCHAVAANMIRLTDNAGIGLQVGEATQLNDLGIVGYAMASSSTLGQAIGLWLQYGSSPVGFPFTLKLLDKLDPGAGESWGVAATPHGISGSVFRFYVEETFVMGMKFSLLLTGKPLEIIDAAFSFPRPAHWQQYERMFQCPIAFDAPETRAVVRAPMLDSPVKSNDSELRELCIRHCTHLVRQISRNGPVSSRLRQVLTTRGSIPALEEAAEALNMSARSLRRYLQDENTSFQKVLDEFRSGLAREYLSAGMMPAKEVAFLLGFSQVDAFRRAFKTWTGKTVGSFQSSGGFRKSRSMREQPQNTYRAEPPQAHW